MLELERVFELEPERLRVVTLKQRYTQRQGQEMVDRASRSSLVNACQVPFSISGRFKITLARSASHQATVSRGSCR